MTFQEITNNEKRRVVEWCKMHHIEILTDLPVENAGVDSVFPLHVYPSELPATAMLYATVKGFQEPDKRYINIEIRTEI
jgi:hypothetical protein